MIKFNKIFILKDEIRKNNHKNNKKYKEIKIPDMILKDEIKKNKKRTKKLLLYNEK
jgi:hypothetical protein